MRGGVLCFWLRAGLPSQHDSEVLLYPKSHPCSSTDTGFLGDILHRACPDSSPGPALEFLVSPYQVSVTQGQDAAPLVACQLWSCMAKESPLLHQLPNAMCPNHTHVPLGALVRPENQYHRNFPKGFLLYCSVYLLPQVTDLLHSSSCFRQLKGNITTNTQKEENREWTKDQDQSRS